MRKRTSIERDLERARAQLDAAEAKASEVRDRRDALWHEARAAGLTNVEIARLSAVNPSRVAQICAARTTAA